VPGPQTGTIRRFVGNLNLSTNIDSTIQFALGISVVNTEVLSAPTNTTVPLPISDTDQDWYYWRAFGVKLELNANGFNFPFDIKTARKLRAGFGLILVFETGVVTGGAVLQAEIQARGLWQTP